MDTKLFDTEFSDEELTAEGKTRKHWFLAELDSLPPIVYIPLRQPLKVSILLNAPVIYEGIPVAVYEKIGKRGRFDEYEYKGDSTK